MAHVTTLRVRFAELDPYNHVNHAAYVSYLEVARTEALESVGLDLTVLAKEGWQLVVTELTVRYRVPAGGGDTLSIETWIEELGGATTRWAQRISRGETLCVEGWLRAGVTDGSGRPRRMPERFRDALRPLLLTPGDAATAGGAGRQRPSSTS